MGPAGSTYDLRFIDGMVEHHTGALRMSEYVFNIGALGVGALANSIWNEQAREIKAMRQWRKAWYPDAPVCPVALRPNGDPNSMADLVRMSPEVISAMRMSGQPDELPTTGIEFGPHVGLPGVEGLGRGEVVIVENQRLGPPQQILGNRRTGRRLIEQHVGGKSAVVSEVMGTAPELGMDRLGEQ